MVYPCAPGNSTHTWSAVIPMKGTACLVTIRVLKLIFKKKNEAKVRPAHRLVACHRLGFLTVLSAQQAWFHHHSSSLSRRTPRGLSSFFLVYFLFRQIGSFLVEI